MFDKSSLDSILTSHAKKKKLSGVSAVICGNDGICYEWNYGARNEKGDTPDRDTVLGVASMSKSITALCLCILEERGKLCLDDPVSKYIPGFSVPCVPGELITIRSMAMHASSLPPMEPLEWSIAMNTPNHRDTPWLREMLSTAPNKMSALDEILDYIAACPYKPLGMPGEIMSYSNEGYAILSYVVDKAAGIDLETFMKDEIFIPLGMTRTLLDNGIDDTRAMAGENLYSLFEIEDGVAYWDDDWSILPPFRGCGLVKSTAKDMAVYYRMLSNFGMHEGRQIISRQVVETLLGKYHPVSRISTMCLGIYKREWKGHTICEHSGALHGVSTKGGLLLGEGYGFAVLCNKGDEEMDELMWCLYNAVIGLPLAEEHRQFVPINADFSSENLICGSYIGHEGVPCRLSIYRQGDRLVLIKDDENLTLKYCGASRYIAVEDDCVEKYRLEFLISGGEAWGVRFGSRVFGRV